MPLKINYNFSNIFFKLKKKNKYSELIKYSELRNYNNYNISNFQFSFLKNKLVFRPGLCLGYLYFSSINNLVLKQLHLISLRVVVNVSWFLLIGHLVDSRHHYFFPKNMMTSLLLVNFTCDKILVQEERFHMAYKSTTELNYICNQGMCAMINNFTDLLYGHCPLTFELHLLIRIPEQQQ